jgi:mannose-6-phosphate isomerase-like protein (cupin superfamily)
MAHVVEDPALRHRLRFDRTTDEDGNEVLRIEMWVDPGGGVPPHIHPAIEERFKVVSGRPSFLAGRKWQTAGPGETVVVPAGLRHAYRNRGDEVAHVICHARPPSQSLQDFLEDTAALAQAGKITRHGLPKSPSALLEAALIVEEHKHMTVLLFPPMPPPWLQRLLFPPLARLARRRGYAPGRAAAGG